MRNPYAKQAGAKRPRPPTDEESSQRAATEALRPSESFGHSDIDWKEAINTMDQASGQIFSKNTTRSESAALPAAAQQPARANQQTSSVKSVAAAVASPPIGKINPYARASTSTAVSVVREPSPAAATNPYAKPSPVRNPYASSSTIVQQKPISSVAAASKEARQPDIRSLTPPRTATGRPRPMQSVGDAPDAPVSIKSSASLPPRAPSTVTAQQPAPGRPKQDIATAVSSPNAITGTGTQPDVRPPEVSFKAPLRPSRTASVMHSTSRLTSAWEVTPRANLSSSAPARSVADTKPPQQSTRALASTGQSLPLPPTWTAHRAAAMTNSISRPSSTDGHASVAASTRPSSAFVQQQQQQQQQQPQDPNALPASLQYSKKKIEPPQDEYRKMLIKNARLSQPLENGWSLFSHQKKAIIQALLMRRMILALDMGLGKTLIGCVWGRAFRDTFGASELKIFVICPASLTKEWRRTAETATGLSVAEEKASENSMDMQICSWAKVPKSVPGAICKYIVVLDEAHSMQSMETARTQAALSLVKSDRCVGVLMLSGTPMKNGKPANLFPLLKAARHPFGENQRAFEIHFCGGRQKSFGTRGVVWDNNGATNLAQLREHVSSHLLHMTKEQCLKDLPPKTREVRQVPVSSRHQLQHNQALQDLARLYATTGSLEKGGELVLTAVQRVRQIGSFAKVEATVALAKEVLEKEPAVVIFTSFAQVAKQVHSILAQSGWEGELLTGETPQKKRQGMVDNFQAGLSPVFVCTFGAGGVGLTLTAAHTIILLDRPWTPGETEQAEDRVRRIGQSKPVTSVFMVAFDLDKQIDSLLEQKKLTTSAVLANGEIQKDSFDAPKISVFQLLRSVLGNKENRGGVGADGGAP